MTRSAFSIFCDDIREESTRKVTYVGVYGTSMIVDSMPAKLPKLCTAIAVYYLLSDPIQSLQFVVMHDNKVIFEPKVTGDELGRMIASADPFERDGQTWGQLRGHFHMNRLDIDGPGKVTTIVRTEREELHPVGLTIIARPDASKSIN